MPDAAFEAIDNDIGGFLFRIIDLRSYASSKRAYEEGIKETDLERKPKGPAIDRVALISAEIDRERFEQAKKR